MGDEKKNYPNSERPQKKKKRTDPQQLLTDNVFTYDVQCTKRTDKRRNLLLA